MSGLVVRETAKRRALGGLGDLCSDSGADFFRTLISAAGAVTSSIGTSEDSTEAQAVGGGLTAFGSAWTASCTPSTSSATGVTQTDLESMYARARDEVLGEAAAAQSSSDATMAMILASMQQQRQSSGIDRNTLLIGGAVLGVGLLAVLLLK